MEEALEEALVAKEKYKRQRKQLAERKKSSYSAKSGQGVATQIKIFADNYKSSFLGIRNVGAGVSHQMSSDSYRREDFRSTTGVVVQGSGEYNRERDTSSFKRAKRAVKKRLFDDEGRKFGIGGDLKEKLKLNNKQLRLVIYVLKLLYQKMFYIRCLKNKFESPPPPRYSSSSNRSEASQTSDRRTRQFIPINIERKPSERVESKPMSLINTQNGSGIFSSPGRTQAHCNRETKSTENYSTNGLYNNRLGKHPDLTIGKRKSEYWTNASDVESDLSFCEVQIECFDM